MKHFADLINQLQATNSRNEKEEILKQVTPLEKDIFNFLFNPFIVTGISKKRLMSLPLPPKNSDCELYDLIALTNYVKQHNTGANRDIDIVLQYAANSNYPELVIAVATKSLTLGVSATTLNKVFGKDFIPMFSVMLADSYFVDPEKLVPTGTEFMITEKLDGVRCVIIKENGVPRFFSRSGKEFEGLKDLYNEALRLPDNTVFDGELKAVGTDSSNALYRKTISIVNSDFPDKSGVVFNCFDCIPLQDFKKGFSSVPAHIRKDRVQGVLYANGFECIRPVPVLYSGSDKAQIDSWLSYAHEHGWEGIMINISDAPYECRRTPNLLKVKTFKECEGFVIGISEGGGRHQGKLGSVQALIKDKNGKTHQVSVGSGFDDNERVSYWKDPTPLLHKVVEIGYFEVTRNQADDTLSLRFPTWLGRIRDDKDQDSMTPISE